MIQKVVEVSNVGKLKEHKAKGDQTFRRLTVIYGENASGKTTLAAILDSLRENSPAIVAGRKTLGSRDDPVVRILASDGLHSYDDGLWNAPYPDLEVFDSDFVSRVVFSGDCVTNDNQKGLCSLLVGRTAVSEGQHLEALRQALNEANARLRDLDGNLRSHIRGSMGVEDFAKLPASTDVDAQLDAVGRQLAAAENIAAVSSKPVPTRTDFPGPDEVLARSVLERSVDYISSDAVNRITAHRMDRMAGSGEPWLREGMRYVDKDRCPFCDQLLAESDFYPLLKRYFSEAYEKYEQDLAADVAPLLQQLDPSNVEMLAERMLRQRDIARTWEEQVPTLDIAALTRDVSATIERAVTSCGAVREAIQAKQREPLRPFHATAFETQFETLAASLEALRAADGDVGIAVAQIDGFRASVEAADTVGLRRCVEQLQNARERHSEAVAPLCDEYLELLKQKAEITAANATARSRMTESMESLLTNYGGAMNAYLESFGSAVRIENPRTNYKTKPPSVDYSISIDGKSVPLGTPASAKDVPCFGNTLSEGEKNLFALSLFLAHVENRADLNNVVVVIDDPVNSLDQERRLLIAETLLTMLDGLSQLVVLTHEPRLAHMLYRSKPHDERKVLCIRREGSTSCIREWETMERDLATDYFRNYFTIADFIGGVSGDWEAAARSLRPFLEDYLRQRFPGEFAVDDWLGSMADRIDAAGPSDPLAVMKVRLGDIRLVAKVTNPRHHGSTHAIGAEALNSSNTEIYAKKALAILN